MNGISDHLPKYGFADNRLDPRALSNKREQARLLVDASGKAMGSGASSWIDERGAVLDLAARWHNDATALRSLAQRCDGAALAVGTLDGDVPGGDVPDG
jgi:hypothetical protein